MTRILVINPGSTSTRIAEFEEERMLWSVTVEHPPEILENYDTVNDQFEMRKEAVRKVLEEKGVALEKLDAVVGRGGLLPGAKPGAYIVDDKLVEELKYNALKDHASNLGAWLAYDIAFPLGIPAFIYDPVTADEMIPLVRITGLVEIQRMVMVHNLNMRAAAIRVAEIHNQKYSDLNIIVAHLGSGITLSLHSKGRVIDTVTDDEGPFSPERAGGLPGFQLIKMATSPGQTYDSMMRKVQREGGLMSHLGTRDAREVEKRIDAGDSYAALVYEAMALNVAKAISRLAVTVCGDVDYIVLTGGIAYSQRFTDWIIQRVSFIAPVCIVPGENEMEALALGGLRVLRGQETARVWAPEIQADIVSMH